MIRLKAQGTRVAAQSLNRLFETTTMAYVDELYGTAVRLTRSERDAEDLVQDTYLRAYRAFHQFEPGTNCRAWLFKILTNTFINGYRRRIKEREILDRQETGALDCSVHCRESMDRYASPDTRIHEGTLCDDVQAALEAVPEDFRTAVVLSDIEGLSYKEIAEIMGTPVGTVMSRLFRGRRLLRKSLWRFGLEEGYLRAVPEEARMAA
jgi:RNA polymerase sigma-70 factor (ECF subfamily)